MLGLSELESITPCCFRLPAAGWLVFRACGLVDVNPRKAQTPAIQKMAIGHPRVDIVRLLAR